MIDVVCAYDVEDVVHPQSDDALLNLCRIYSEEDVPVSLFVVGEKARVLRQRGRHDVIAAMRPHEICYHGNYWGDFPEPALSYGSRLPFDEAVKFALEVELPGLHDVADITGQFPVTWCCHQAQQCPPLSYAYKLAGVRCWAGGPRGWIMNWLSWGRSNCALSNQGDCTQRVDPLNRTVKPAADPEADLAFSQAAFERMAAERDFITFTGHPVCFVTDEWCLYELAMVFRDGQPGAYPRPDNFTPVGLRSPEDQAAALEYTRKLLRWLKSRPDVNLTNYTALCERDEEDPILWITWAQAVELARQVLQRFNYLTAFGTSFSCADVMGVLTFALDYAWRHGCWPDRLPVQRLVGPTEQPLDSGGPLKLRREEILSGALAAYSIMMDRRRIPGRLRATFVDVGPGEWLHILAQFITRSVDEGVMPLEVEIPAVPMLPEAAAEPVITERQFGSSNRAPGLDYSHLWDLLRWQSWSYRPPVSH
jgi:hypothetical protein